MDESGGAGGEPAANYCQLNQLQEKGTMYSWRGVPYFSYSSSNLPRLRRSGLQAARFETRPFHLSSSRLPESSALSKCAACGAAWQAVSSTHPQHYTSRSLEVGHVQRKIHAVLRQTNPEASQRVQVESKGKERFVKRRNQMEMQNVNERMPNWNGDDARKVENLRSPPQHERRSCDACRQKKKRCDQEQPCR